MFGQNLRFYRLPKGMTKGELAKAIGASAAIITVGEYRICLEKLLSLNGNRVRLPAYEILTRLENIRD